MLHRKHGFPGGRAWLVAAALPLAAGCRGHSGRHHDDRLTEAELREEMKEHAEDVLDMVDATDRQIAAVGGVIDGVAPDVVRFHDERAKLRAEFQRALSADRIDRAEIERLRKEAVALVDRASVRAADALVDAAEVLTAKQRRDLVAKWRRHTR